MSEFERKVLYDFVVLAGWHHSWIGLNQVVVQLGEGLGVELLEFGGRCLKDTLDHVDLGDEGSWVNAVRIVYDGWSGWSGVVATSTTAKS